MATAAMTPPGDAGFWSGLIAGTGGSLLTFAGTWLSTRGKREQRIEDRVMKRMETELSELRSEVSECRARDKRVLYVEMVCRLVVPELRRVDPGNPALSQIDNLLRALPIPETGPEWAGILKEIDKAEAAAARAAK